MLPHAPPRRRKPRRPSGWRSQGLTTRLLRLFKAALSAGRASDGPSENMHRDAKLGFDEAKALLSITTLWHLEGLPGEPKKACTSPFGGKKGKFSSFYVASDGFERWHDYVTGEGGDAVDFLALARGLSNKEACVEFLRLAGAGTGPQDL